jgi:site-specific recombinase XerD
MATTTIHKRIQFARQFMHDAVDWKIIDENPFCEVKTQKSSVKVNEFVPREVVDKLMKKANPVWQKPSRSLATRANTWSRLPSIERLLTRRWVGRMQTYAAR